MGNKRNPQRDGTARGLWKLFVEEKYAPISIPAQPLVAYCVREDNLFPGTWLAEPVKYIGRGIVYIFRGENARAQARAWAAAKNAERGKALRNEIP